jgi:hypothetical protein
MQRDISRNNTNLADVFMTRRHSNYERRGKMARQLNVKRSKYFEIHLVFIRQLTNGVDLSHNCSFT